MTVLVAYRSKKDKKLYLAADTQVSFGDSKQNGINKLLDYPKAGIYIAVSGSLAIYRVLSTWCPPYYDGKLSKNDTIGFMYTTIIPNLMQYLEDNKVASVDKNIIYAYQNLFIIYNGICFSVGGDGAVTEVETFDTSGCGYRYAMGYLEAVYKMEIPDREKVVGAIKCAGKYDIYCNQDVNIMEIDI